MRDSWARWPPDSLPAALARAETELGEARMRRRRVPPGIAVRAEAQVVLDGEPRVEGRFLRDEADAGELGGVACGLIAEHLDRAGTWREQPGGEIEQCGLARAVRADETDDMATGDAQRAVLERPAAPIALAEALGLERRVAHDPT